MDGFDVLIINLFQKLIHMLPYGNLHCLGAPIGEYVYTLVGILGIGELIAPSKKVKK